MTIAIILWLFSGVIHFIWNIPTIIMFTTHVIGDTWKVVKWIWWLVSFLAHVLSGPAGLIVSFINHRAWGPF